MKAILFLIIGFIFLIKGADLLIKGAGSLAKRLNVPEVVIGLTVVAFGTSTAELFVNIFASIEGVSDIVIGNILGSNIFNVLLILGVSAVITPLKVTKNTIWKEIPLSLLAAVVFVIIANDALIDGAFSSGLSRIDGLILISFFFIFIFYIFTVASDYQDITPPPVYIAHTLSAVLCYVIIGLAGLIIGSKFVVDAAIAIAQMFHVSESFIALTVVAAGTSLPELSTSVVAAVKKNSDIAIGNIVGSNIFNIFFILGLSVIIHPVPYKLINNFDALVGVAASLLMFVFMFTGKKKEYDRSEGALFVVLYIAYIAVLFYRG